MHPLPFAGMQGGEFSHLNQLLISVKKSSSLPGANPNASVDMHLLRWVGLEELVREISKFEGPQSEEGLTSHAIC